MQKWIILLVLLALSYYSISYGLIATGMVVVATIVVVPRRKKKNRDTDNIDLALRLGALEEKIKQLENNE